MIQPLKNIADPVKILLSELRHRFVYERADKGFRRHILETLEPKYSRAEFLHDATQLLEHGIVIKMGYLASRIAEIQREFESVIDEYKIVQGKMGVNPEECALGHISVVSEALRKCPALSLLAVDPYLTKLAAYYWGKQVVLAQSGGNRLEPIDYPGDYRSFQWHHDAKRKQIKAMILLTDVASEDQRMLYLPGTHLTWHRNRLDSRRTPEQALSFGPEIEAIGPAGTVIMFDTNGLHRGNRTNTRRRDTWTFTYTAGKYLFPICLAPSIVPRLTTEQRRIARIGRSR